MKKLIILLLLSVPINLLAQNSQIENIEDSIIITNASYSKIVESDVPIKTKFLNAKQWIAKTYGDYKAVLQLEDDENGKIIIKGISPLEKETDYNQLIKSSYIRYPKIRYTLTIDCRDDKFRAKFESISIQLTVTSSMDGITRTSEYDLSYEEYTKDQVLELNQAAEKAQAKIDAIQADPSNLKKKEATKEIALQLQLIAAYKAKIPEGKEQTTKRRKAVRDCLGRLIKSLTESITVVDDF